MISFLLQRDTWQEILSSIGKNKIRTGLTVVGVLWGIFVYIAMSGAAKGLDNGFERAFESVAKNSLFVFAQSTSKPYGGYKTGRRLSITLSDVETLKSELQKLIL